MALYFLTHTVLITNTEVVKVENNNYFKMNAFTDYIFYPLAALICLIA